MNEIIVQKFGGTSVGSVERIDAVAEIIKKASESKKIIVVVSAMGGETNRLVDLAKHFGVTGPTVNSIIRRLVREGLVESRPYRSIFLTEKGKLLADYCKKRHEIVYNFLIKIGVNEDVAKNDAEGLEHHVSAETLSVFEKFNKT